MRLLYHDETESKHPARPRHPIVATLNIAGMLFGTVGCAISTTPATKSYFLAMVLLYAFSLLHHWLPYRAWTTRLDHAMIFIFIAFTAVPYWGAFIPLTNPPEIGLALIVAIAFLGGVAKLFTFFPRLLSGMLYGLASLPIIAYMTSHMYDVGLLHYVLWMTGIALYMTQLIVYTWRLFELAPKWFGHREVQHLQLLPASMLHGIVALQIVG